MVKVITGAYESRYVCAEVLAFGTDLEPVDICVQWMISVVPEHFGTPLNYELPGTKGDAALPRQFQVELRLLVVLVV